MIIDPFSDPILYPLPALKPGGLLPEERGAKISVSSGLVYVKKN